MAGPRIVAHVSRTGSTRSAQKHEVGSDVDGFSCRDDRYKTRVIDLARE
jgi:hypothetical protein